MKPPPRLALEATHEEFRNIAKAPLENRCRVFGNARRRAPYNI